MQSHQINPELAERNEVTLGVQVKDPKTEKAPSRILAIQLLSPGGNESFLLKLTMHPHPEVADPTVAEESSLAEAEATGALTLAVQVVAAVGKQVAGAARTIGQQPTVATTMHLLIKNTSGRHHLAVVGMDMGVLSQIRDVLGTVARLEVKALNMKRCQREGDNGDLKQAARVLVVTLLPLTRKTASLTPRPEERTLQQALHHLQLQSETPRQGCSLQGECHQDVAEVEVVLEGVSIEVEALLECLVDIDLDLALLLMAGLQNLQLSESNRRPHSHPLLKIQAVE